MKGFTSGTSFVLRLLSRERRFLFCVADKLKRGSRVLMFYSACSLHPKTLIRNKPTAQFRHM